jgi:hypothetical protein
MARDFTPQHKEKLKEIIEGIEYDDEKFEDRSSEHVFTNAISDIQNYPTITITNEAYLNQVEDTGYNRITNTYAIRVFFAYQEPIELTESAINELISLIQTTLVDYMWGVDDNWEHMNFTGSGRLTDTGQGVVYKEMTIDLINREPRNSIPI